MKRTSLAICMMGLVLGAAACQTTPEEPATTSAVSAQAKSHTDAPPLPKAPVMVSFAPGDLTTATFETPITIFVDNSGSAVSPELLDKLASQIELRTYPELQPVEAEIEVHPSQPLPRTVRSGDRKSASGKAAVGDPASSPEGSESLPAHPGRASIIVRPLQPLAIHWHVVSIGSLPEGTRAVAWTGPADSALGAFSARFHPGSAPVVRDVKLCEKQNGRAARLIATFSEPLRAEERAAELVRARDARSGEVCTVVSPAAPDVPQSLLEIDCPASVLKTGAVDLDVGAGLVSTRGAPLSSIDARGRAVDIEDALDFTDAEPVSGCRTVTMQ